MNVPCWNEEDQQITNNKSQYKRCLERIGKRQQEREIKYPHKILGLHYKIAQDIK